ncbi:NAD(P)-binding protein [Ramaria rubella]|nr:NAD(P)-binding protein [Ramaria rubella]
MAPVPNPRVLYAKIPVGVPIIGQDLVYDDIPTIDLDKVPLNGGYLTKTLVLSPAPYMRERMRDRSIDSYSTIMQLGIPVVSIAVVVVLRSEDPKVKAGDHMVGHSTWEAYTVQPYPQIEFKPEEWGPWTFNMDSVALQVVPNPGNAIPWTNFCSVLGTPGLTAFVGFETHARAQAGETIYVSSAASGVGQMVVQLAKARGLKVIASTGSPRKVEFLKKLGADVAFNYKETTVDEVLSKHGLINIYWDNVGGETLETAIRHTALNGRIILSIRVQNFQSCGSISEYNIPFEKRYGIQNMSEIWKRRLTVSGFLVPDLAVSLAGRFFTEIPLLVAQGKIQVFEHFTRGLENAAQVFVDLLEEGGTLGKPLIVVADE